MDNIHNYKNLLNDYLFDDVTDIVINYSHAKIISGNCHTIYENFLWNVPEPSYYTHRKCICDNKIYNLVNSTLTIYCTNQKKYINEVQLYDPELLYDIDHKTILNILIGTYTNEIFIPDTKDEQIVVFDMETGRLKRKLKYNNEKVDSIKCIYDVKISYNEQYIYMIDLTANIIRKMSTNGEIVDTRLNIMNKIYGCGECICNPGYWVNVTKIALHNEYIYVLAGLYTVYVFNLIDGSLLCKFEILENIDKDTHIYDDISKSIHISGEEIYISYCDAGVIQIFTLQGNFIREIDIHFAFTKRLNFLKNELELELQKFDPICNIDTNNFILIWPEILNIENNKMYLRHTNKHIFELQ